jgi:hypothetical protein
MSDLIVNPFTDIIPPTVPVDSALQKDYNEWSMGGGGANGLKADQQGMWFGSKKFADAVFSVDMAGNVKANSITLGGYIPTGGAAADINNGTTQISGGKIVTGSINASSMVVGSMRQIFTSTPTIPYAVGDLWSAGSSGDLKRCIVARTTGSYTASDWDLASKYTDDSNTTTIIGNTVTTAYLNAKNITAAGVVTGALIQTDSGTYAGVKMSSSLGGLVIYGQTMQIRDSSDTLYGSIGGQSGYFNINAVSGRNMLIGADNATVFFANTVAPLYTGSANLGTSSFRWGNVYTLNLDLNGGNYYINYSGGFIQSNSQFRVVGSINVTGNMVFENNASITINGRAFYATMAAFDPTKYYLRS